MASPQHPDSPIFRRFFQPGFEGPLFCHRISDEDYLVAGILRCLSDSRTGRDFLHSHGDGGRADIPVDLFFKAIQSGYRFKNLASTNVGFAPLMAASAKDPFASIPELAGFAIYAGDGHYHTAAVHDPNRLDRSGTICKEAAGHFFLLDLRAHFLSHLTGADQGGVRKCEHEMHAIKLPFVVWASSRRRHYQRDQADQPGRGGMSSWLCRFDFRILRKRYRKVVGRVNPIRLTICDRSRCVHCRIANATAMASPVDRH